MGDRQTVAHPALVGELSRRLGGAVYGDTITRALYSTDASMYAIMPVAVIEPRDDADLATALEICQAQNVPLLVRGAGTSLAGQAVGAAVVADCSRHLNKLVRVDESSRTAWVQPGMVLDALNAELARLGTGLMFGPDVAPSNRATVGGMILNNSCGAHSIVYGKTLDHVRGVKGWLADGSQLETGRWRAAGVGGARQTEIEGAMAVLVHRHAGEIERRFPKILRRVGGYNLDAVLADARAAVATAAQTDASRGAAPRGDLPGVDLTKLIVGSEGTLAVVGQAAVGLVARPRRRGLMVIEFDSLFASLDATLAILSTAPAAVEVVDATILDMASRQPEMRHRRARVLADAARTPAAQLLVEYFADSEEELLGRLADLDGLLRRGRLGTWHKPLVAAEDQADAWAIRKAGVGLLQGMIGDRKPQTFVEDCGVAPGQLPEFARRFCGIVERHGTHTAAYAHASAGLLHFRPVLSLKSAVDRATMRAIAAEVVELALEFGGAMSGEHGDGLARSCWNRRMFGDELYGAFEAVKAAFDPRGLLNPGKIVGAPDMLEHLRHGPNDRGLRLTPKLDFGVWGGVGGHVELCNGNGACRKSGGQMCPSFQVTGREADSPRGRANALRAIMTGHVEDRSLGGDALASDELAAVMDLCIGCKGCQIECPSNVDVGRLKSEVLHHRHQVRGVPVPSWVFGRVGVVNRLGHLAAPMSNWLAGTGMARAVNRWALGISEGRSLPRFAEQTLSQWWVGRRRPRPRSELHRTGPDSREVVVMADCFCEYNQPEIGRAAVRVIEAVGGQVQLGGRGRCCGRPAISRGLLDEARRQAMALVRSLSGGAGGTPGAGRPVVVLEPSCLSVLRDELADLMPAGPWRQAARALARRAVSLEEWLVANPNGNRHGGRYASSPPARATTGAGRYLVHGHCHHKAIGAATATLTALRAFGGTGAQVAMITAGCCGMAGSFGYEAQHIDISRRMAELDLLPAVRAADAATVIVAGGTSCRHQIADGTGRIAHHPAVVLAEMMDASGAFQGAV